MHVTMDINRGSPAPCDHVIQFLVFSEYTETFAFYLYYCSFVKRIHVHSKKENATEL